MRLLTTFLFVCTSSLTLAAPMQKATEVLGGYPAQNLLDTHTDILGNAIDYPEQSCNPRIHSDIITMAPGQTGAKHTHVTPLYAQILSGTIKVDYEGYGINTYTAGDTFMEAMHVVHHGYNDSDKPASLLAVYMDCKK
ncbi:hypothetial protein [Aequoribacter fuscus]|uniref:Hypothetial protein n=1 Tax=Aequoribacter fuscus TaxID=2518989 RepID=F3L1C1_9GAMM|nr:cupin domain-containing protein [Aequoribacter fuscus]EGG29869.1 hypothetial protein [Aequoribacter fuscus]QHJ88831.1 cupin domain-containing protein [Aequoribacter fuscus]